MLWVSHSLWRELTPQIGFEEFHCHQKRGFSRARGKEPKISLLKQQDNVPQRIGKLAQTAIYYLYHHPEYLTPSKIDIFVTKFLNLSQELPEVQEKVRNIIELYLNNPFLQEQKVIKLYSGQESKPDSLIFTINSYSYKLYFVFDCVVEQNSHTIHIVDFKTGKEQYDKRQAFVYLLAGQYIYKNKNIVVSFYNLESGQQSEIYSATKEELEFIKIRLAKVASEHDKEIKLYKNKSKSFEQIFPASPGKGCQYCSYTSICKNYAEYSCNS